MLRRPLTDDDVPVTPIPNAEDGNIVRQEKGRVGKGGPRVV